MVTALELRCELQTNSREGGDVLTSVLKEREVNIFLTAVKSKPV